MVQHDEKRQFQRLNVETDLSFQVGDRDIIHQGKSVDLSATGLHLMAAIAPQKGESIAIVMHPNNERLPPFEAEGEILRVDADTEDKGLFHIFISLTNTM